MNIAILGNGPEEEGWRTGFLSSTTFNSVRRFQAFPNRVWMRFLVRMTSTTSWPGRESKR